MITAMKALVYIRPMNVEVRGLDAPQLRACNVLVRVRACGVCGSDLHGFRATAAGEFHR
jgi:D-arabinose 1-dehydrogenase-like Zn-dependent alcohol dehydrogenase